MNTTLQGRTVALFRCPAWIQDEDPRMTYVSGLFVLEEYTPYEPAAYHHESGWFVYPATPSVTVYGQPIVVGEDSGPALWVADDALLPQIDPKGCGRMAAQEREMEWMAEQEHEIECGIKSRAGVV